MHVDKAIATSLRIEISSPITNFRDEASKKLSVIIVFTVLGDRLHLAGRRLICEARKGS